ncbi:MAG: tRNA uridine-5-carboxymethylaminomethyl(34) synthesis GTPase MnmE [Rhodospirillales bacterium]|nr:tRNA uridine-5-carboxymethylaminomethyl(34) synthesis GTPase MnmE [Rhodospirillales bacterium]
MKAGTIFAVASGVGKAGVAVIRVSGDAAESLFTTLRARCPQPRTATRVSLFEPLTGRLLDEALALWFPAPKSFTGENVVELHVHGGRAVIDGVMAVLTGLHGFRLAEPGEFTRRAFENNKMDLTAAEGLADLVDAETSAQRDQALRQMQGALGDLYEDWRHRLLRASAYLETTIDFAEEDIPVGLEADVRSQVTTLKQQIAAHLSDGHRGERLRDGVRVAIVGAPNAGKSSLLNQLAAREAAIVSARAGTTRDVIEVHLALAGIPVVLSDTAGIRKTSDEIESEGVRRALAQAAQADFRVLVADPGQTPLLSPDLLALIDVQTLVVLNKADLNLPVDGHFPCEAVSVSALTGLGIKELLETLTSKVRDRFDLTDQPSLTRARHRTALDRCLQALTRFEEVPSLIDRPELGAENLRSACMALGHITGRVDVEDVLDVIFRDFCIGK